MSNILLKGIYPALPTPLRDDGTVDLKDVSRLMDWELSCGVKGFYVLGGTGEGCVLNEKERMRMAEEVMRVRKNATIVLQIGDIDPFAARRLAKHAASIGADAISSVCPNFYFQYNADEICAYYDSLVQSSGLPMICYCNALVGNQDVVALVRKLMQVPGVIGIKYTMPDYFKLNTIKKINDGDINVINGPDQTLLCGLMMGADAGIGTTYNMRPDWFVRLYNAYMSGNWEEARKYQFKIDDMIRVSMPHGGIQVTKLVLSRRGFDMGHAAFPGRHFTGDEKAQIIRDMTACGVMEPTEVIEADH